MNEIYIFGDSAAQGIVLDESGQYRVSRAGCMRLLKRSGYPIRNYAMHGYTIRQGLECFRKMKPEKGSTCIIEFGGNDCDLDWDAVASDPEVPHEGKVPLAEFRQVLRQFVGEVRESGADPILVTPMPLIPDRYFRWVSRGRDAGRILRYLRGDKESIYRWQERYSIAIRQVTAELRCNLADLRLWMLDEWDRYPSLVCADGIHPNEAGHHAIAEAAARYFPLSS